MTTLMKNPARIITPVSQLNLADRFFRDSFSDLWTKSITETIPSVNIIENKENFSIELAVPGMKKSDFKIEVNGDIMTISSEKESENSEEGKNYWKKEYNYSSFSRSFTLPETANRDKIAATYKDGILVLNVPKNEGAIKNSVKKITVG
jgi:HSP20 family protein